MSLEKIKEIKQLTDTGYVGTPIGCDAENVDFADGRTLEEVSSSINQQISDLNQAIANATALKASLEAYGMVKLNDTSVVTNSTGLSLPATEKNPNISGTLANQLAQLNTDYKKCVVKCGRYLIPGNDSVSYEFDKGMYFLFFWQGGGWESLSGLYYLEVTNWHVFLNAIVAMPAVKSGAVELVTSIQNQGTTDAIKTLTVINNVAAGFWMEFHRFPGGAA